MILLNLKKTQTQNPNAMIETFLDICSKKIKNWKRYLERQEEKIEYGWLLGDDGHNAEWGGVAGIRQFSPFL